MKSSSKYLLYIFLLGLLGTAVYMFNRNKVKPIDTSPGAPEGNNHDIVVLIEDGKTFVRFNQKTYPCSIGANGITPSEQKVEGDKCTPAGTFPLREVFYRGDRVTIDETTVKLASRQIKETDGWCDEPNHADYNKLVDLSTFDQSVSHEKLWREDNLYDIVVVIGYNDVDPMPGKGSAIFLHVASEGYGPTAGCVGLSKEDLLEILPNLTPDSKIIIQAPVQTEGTNS